MRPLTEGLKKNSRLQDKLFEKDALTCLFTKDFRRYLDHEIVRKNILDEYLFSENFTGIFIVR